jgi:hypothetical protein
MFVERDNAIADKLIEVQEKYGCPNSFSMSWAKDQKPEVFDIVFKLIKNPKFNLADLEIHDTMLSLYREKKFDGAVKFCHTLKGCFNGELDHYYDLWEQRCEEMKTAVLPDDWDGTFVANSK